VAKTPSFSTMFVLGSRSTASEGTVNPQGIILFGML